MLGMPRASDEGCTSDQHRRTPHPVTAYVWLLCNRSNKPLRNRDGHRQVIGYNRSGWSGTVQGSVSENLFTTQNDPFLTRLSLVY